MPNCISEWQPQLKLPSYRWNLQFLVFSYTLPVSDLLALAITLHLIPIWWMLIIFMDLGFQFVLEKYLLNISSLIELIIHFILLPNTNFQIKVLNSLWLSFLTYASILISKIWLLWLVKNKLPLCFLLIVAQMGFLRQ